MDRHFIIRSVNLNCLFS